MEAYNTPPHQSRQSACNDRNTRQPDAFNARATTVVFGFALRTRLTYAIRLVSNDGPVRVSVDSNGVVHADSLRLHGYGPGNAVVEVADPQGMTTQANISTETRFVPLVTLRMQAYNGQTENDGSVIINGQTYLITPAAPQLATPAQSGHLSTISGITLNADTAASYFRTDANIHHQSRWTGVPV